MCVFVHWGTSLSDKICVKRGTRQGGLTSPFIFNLFYKDLIEDLNKCNYGITINGFNFNVMCYADDILLCSVTNYGLQCLIDRAVQYTVKLEMFADINVCEFVILEVFALLKFANLGLFKVNFLFPTNSVLLLLLEIGYIY